MATTCTTTTRAAAPKPELEGLASQLRAFNGHRSLWIDDASGQICHEEPEAELEALGYRYVGTVFAPQPDELASLLTGRFWPLPELAPEPEAAAPARLPMGLVPLQSM